MSISFLLWMWPTLVAFLLLLAISQSERVWKHRRIVAEATVGLLLAGLPFVITTRLPIVSEVLLGLVQLWGVLLGARLLFGRLPEEFLRRSTHFNSVVALGIFVVVFDAWLIVAALHVPNLTARQVLTICLLFPIVVGLGFLYQVLWTLKHYQLRNLDASLRAKDLPTLTLAIPARNETHALEACLRTAVGSDYPKLEILVLDDCSQDKTSEIIRSFAKRGVRFIQGKVPAEGWLGKNQALGTLADQATGDFVLFVDVDTHLSPRSVSQLMMYALSNHLDMVTVLPQRRDGWSFATTLTYLRYFWQIALPVTARRVPVASQLWLIRRATLKTYGGFAAVQHKIVPEGYFARQLIVRDAYRFIISNEELGITTAKRWSSQIETAIRFLYPTFKRQPYLVLLGGLLLISLMILPFVVLLFVRTDMRLFAPAAVACGLFWFTYCLVVIRTHAFTWPVTVLLLPAALVQELVLLVASMLVYEFGTVNWKGRNVCYPVIHMDRERAIKAR